MPPLPTWIRKQEMLQRENRNWRWQKLTEQPLKTVDIESYRESTWQIDISDIQFDAIFILKQLQDK